MRKRKAATAAADEAPRQTLPGSFFRRNTSELPPNYKRPLHRQRLPPRQLKPLELAYWREHQIKIKSLAYLNSKRFSTRDRFPPGTDFAILPRRGGEHRRVFILDRLPLPAPDPTTAKALGAAFGQRACACGKELYGCAPPGGGCEGGCEGGCGGCSESGSGCGEAGGGAGGCGAGGGGAGGCGGCDCAGAGGCGGCSCGGCAAEGGACGCSGTGGGTCGGCDVGGCGGPGAGGCTCGGPEGCAPADVGAQAGAPAGPSGGLCVGSDANCTGGFCGACTTGGGGCTAGAGSGCLGGGFAGLSPGDEVDLGQGVIGTVGLSQSGTPGIVGTNLDFGPPGTYSAVSPGAVQGALSYGSIVGPTETAVELGQSIADQEAAARGNAVNNAPSSMIAALSHAIADPSLNVGQISAIASAFGVSTVGPFGSPNNPESIPAPTPPGQGIRVSEPTPLPSEAFAFAPGTSTAEFGAPPTDFAQADFSQAQGGLDFATTPFAGTEQTAFATQPFGAPQPQGADQFAPVQLASAAPGVFGTNQDMFPMGTEMQPGGSILGLDQFVPGMGPNILPIAPLDTAPPATSPDTFPIVPDNLSPSGWSPQPNIAQGPGIAPPTEGAPIGGDFNLPAGAGAGALAGIFGGLAGGATQTQLAASNIYQGGSGALAFMGAGGILPSADTQEERAREQAAQAAPAADQDTLAPQDVPPEAQVSPTTAALTPSEAQAREQRAAEGILNMAGYSTNPAIAAMERAAARVEPPGPGPSLGAAGILQGTSPITSTDFAIDYENPSGPIPVENIADRLMAAPSENILDIRGQEQQYNPTLVLTPQDRQNIQDYYDALRSYQGAPPGSLGGQLGINELIAPNPYEGIIAPEGFRAADVPPEATLPPGWAGGGFGAYDRALMGTPGAQFSPADVAARDYAGSGLGGIPGQAEFYGQGGSPYESILAAAQFGLPMSGQERLNATMNAGLPGGGTLAAQTGALGPVAARGGEFAPSPYGTAPPEETPADRVAGAFGPFAPGAEYVPPTFPAPPVPTETHDQRNARLTAEISGQFGRTAQSDQEQFANRTAKNDYAPTISPNTGFPQLDLKPAEGGPAAPVDRDITTMDLPVLDAERQAAIRGDPNFTPTYPTLPSPQEAYRGIDPRLASPTAPALEPPSVLDQMGRTIPPVESAPLPGLGMPWGQGYPLVWAPPAPVPQTVDRTGKSDMLQFPAREGKSDLEQYVDRAAKGDFITPDDRLGRYDVIGSWLSDNRPASILDQMGRTIPPIAGSPLANLGMPWGQGRPFMPDFPPPQTVDRTGKGDLQPPIPAAQEPSVLDQMGRTIPPIESTPLPSLGMPWGQGQQGWPGIPGRGPLGPPWGTNPPFNPPVVPPPPPLSDQVVDRTGKGDLQFVDRTGKGDFLGPAPTAPPPEPPQQPPWPPEQPPPPATTVPPAAPTARPTDEQVRQTVEQVQAPIQTPSGLQVSLPQLASMFADPSYFWEAQTTAQELLRRAQAGDPVAMMQLQMLDQMMR